MNKKLCFVVVVFLLGSSLVYAKGGSGKSGGSWSASKSIEKSLKSKTSVLNVIA